MYFCKLSAQGLGPSLRCSCGWGKQAVQGKAVRAAAQVCRAGIPLLAGECWGARDCGRGVKGK